MSTRPGEGGEGGKTGRAFFLSSHRCPEVDLLPHHNFDIQIPPSCSPGHEITCTGLPEENYLGMFSTCHLEEEETEEEKGSISDWSEEDLSLHFSPSVILPSDEESDPETGFECIDVTMETLVTGQREAGLKMVPKRQIHLKKKNDTEIKTELQVPVSLHICPSSVFLSSSLYLSVCLQVMKDEPAEGTVETSANELVCPVVRSHPDLLLRQHSMPASTSCCKVNSYGVCKGLDAGPRQGLTVGGNSRQRLQKSFSLDETKTKMASCIIKSVLSKKMQAELKAPNFTSTHKNSVVLPDLQPTDLRMIEGSGNETGRVVFKAPVHAVRDMRGLAKNAYSLSFSTTTPSEDNKNMADTKLLGQEESPPPTYQQAVRVKGHNEKKTTCQATVYSSSIRGDITTVAPSLSQSQNRKHSNRFSHPVTQQRQESQPITNRIDKGNVTLPVQLQKAPTNSCVRTNLIESSQSEAERGASNQEETSTLPSGFIKPSPPHLSISTTLLSAPEHSSIQHVSSQQILHPCFYTPTPLTTFSSTICPLSYIHNQLQPSPPTQTLHLMRRSEEKQTSSEQSCHFIHTETIRDQQVSSVLPPAGKQQYKQQQQIQCSVQGFLPAQVGKDITVAPATQRAIFCGPAHSPIMLNPQSGQCFYLDTLLLPQRKMLLDPETGQYVQVFIPVASSTPNSSTLPVCFSNPAPSSAMNPAIMSVMQLQPTVPLSSLYSASSLPFTLHTSSVNVDSYMAP